MATVEAVEHDMSSHGGYLKRSEELIDQFIKREGIEKASMTEAQAKKLLKFMEKDPFIKGFNDAVLHSTAQEVTEWVRLKGYKLLPEPIQGGVLKRATALSIKNGWIKSVAKKGTGPFLTIGFAVLTAERMYAHGASNEEVGKAVADDLAFGIPGLLEAGGNAAWDEANSIALQVRNGAFSYLDYDPESSKYDGSNGLLTSEQAVDAILRRQDNGGDTVTAGSLLGW